MAWREMLLTLVTEQSLLEAKARSNIKLGLLSVKAAAKERAHKHHAPVLETDAFLPE